MLIEYFWMKKFINSSTKIIVIALLVLSIPVGVTYASYKLNKLQTPGGSVEGDQTTKQNGAIQPIVYEETTVDGQVFPKVNKLIDNSKNKSVFPKPNQTSPDNPTTLFPDSYTASEKSADDSETASQYYENKIDLGVTSPSEIRFSVRIMDHDNLYIQNLNDFVVYEAKLNLYWKNSANNIVISSYDLGKISFHGGLIFRKDSTINSTPVFANGTIMRQNITFKDVKNDSYIYN